VESPDTGGDRLEVVPKLAVSLDAFTAWQCRSGAKVRFRGHLSLDCPSLGADTCAGQVRQRRIEMSHDFNMSMRKFLKQVGVTSQQQIEEAVRTAGKPGQSYEAKVVLTIDGLNLEHTVTGTISGQD